MAEAMENASTSSLSSTTSNDAEFGIKLPEMYKETLAGTFELLYDRHVFLCQGSHASCPSRAESFDDSDPRTKRAAMWKAIDGADGFQNTHQIPQYESAKFGIDQVVFILEKVHIIWEPLLLPSTYKRSICTVLETVFCRMTKDILLLDDMAAKETIQLQRLIHMKLESLSSLLNSLNTTTSQTGKSHENLSRPLDDLIPSLAKIRKLADLLDIAWKSITESRESGELVSCGFTSSEVEDFVRAIFTDSPLGRDCLWRIESTSSYKSCF